MAHGFYSRGQAAAKTEDCGLVRLISTNQVAEQDFRLDRTEPMEFNDPIEFGCVPTKKACGGAHPRFAGSFHA